MKTTDRVEVKKNNTYHFIKDNEIVKVKCTDIYTKSGFCLRGTTYHFSINYGRSYYPLELRGILYKSYNKAKNRLKRSLKKTIKNYEKILEKLNG
jgi:hypothetical protein